MQAAEVITRGFATALTGRHALASGSRVSCDVSHGKVVTEAVRYTTKITKNCLPTRKRLRLWPLSMSCCSLCAREPETNVAGFAPST